MHLTPAHGDVGIYGADVPFLLLRPSLRNIASLGDPAEIIAVFESVMSAGHSMQVADAMGVLWACYEGVPADGEKTIGYYDGEIRQGSMETVHKIHIARHLLQHGMVGEIVPKAESGSKAIKEFRASDFVALAIAHLGMSQNDAWGLSMTALTSALTAKFPPQKNKNQVGGNAPTIDEHDETMAWFDKIRGKQ